MAPKKVDLTSYSADELLAELRLRESAPNEDELSIARKSTVGSALADISSAEIAKALREAQKLIYGTDDRQDLFAVTDVAIKKSANGVASLIDISNIEDNGDGTSSIRTVKFGDAQNLCSGERFRNQPTSPFCTGFLVGEQLLATAGHCINGNTLARTRYVFGFEMKSSSTANVIIPNGDIYTGISIVSRKLEDDGVDYALVKLDRPVNGRTILPVRRTGKILNNRNVYVLGHPSGLPLKYAPNANVRDNSPAGFFVANLDTYGGNSGSPVFDQQTHLVEGILVRGDTDFVLAGECFVSNVCPTSGCQGEEVTRSTEFAQFIPDTKQGSSESSDIDARVEHLEVEIKGIREVLTRIEKKLE
jgi:hypothetical protein